MILPNIQNLQFDLRKISDFVFAQKNVDEILRADIGEPNIPPPKEIYEITEKILPDEKFAYAPTFGLPKLVESIKDFEKEKLKNFSDPEVLVTCGGQAALFSIFAAVLKPGDEVLVPEFYYPPYKSLATISQAKLICADFENSEDLEEKITEKTKILLLNSPNNPTGKIFSREEIKNISNIIESKNILVISDDVYDQIHWDVGDNLDCHLRIPHIAEFLPEKTLAVNSVSKNFCLTGARIGWISGEKNLVGNVAKVHRNINSCPNSLAQKAVAEFLPISQKFIAELNTELKKRAKKIYEVFQNLGWEQEEIKGSIYAFPKIPDLVDSEEFIFNLISERKVSAIPGVFFGERNADRVRFCFGALSVEEIEELGKRLK